MDEDKIKNMIAEYIRENMTISVSIDEDYSGFNNYLTVRATVSLNGEEISSSDSSIRIEKD